LRGAAAGALIGGSIGAVVAGLIWIREHYLAQGLSWLALAVSVAEVGRLLLVGAILGALAALAAHGNGTAARVRELSVATAGAFGVGAMVALGEMSWPRYLAETSLSLRISHALGLFVLASGLGILQSLVARRPARALAVSLAGMLFALGAGALAPLLRAPPAGPNLILLSIDTLRADRLGSYGYAAARTPNIDALAAGGTLFETVISSAPVTLPSMATLMTGLDPGGHGARYNGFYRVRGAPVTLAEWLAERGYRTGAVVGNFALDSSFGIAQGFSFFDDQMTAMMGPHGARTDVPAGANWWTRSLATQPAQRFASEVTDAGLAWLARRGGRPFFLWLHYMDPHQPYQPPAEYRGQHHPYDGEISYVDAEIGRLLTTYRARFPAAETLVVVVADHGESLGEHGIQGHVFALYEQMVRIPLILNLPGRISPGVRVAQPLRGRDAPLEILRAMGQLGGSPLLAQASDRVLGGQDWIAYSETWQPVIAGGTAPMRSLRSDRFKYIRRKEGDRLYDLEVDPGEQNDAIDEMPEIARRMRVWLDASDSGVGDAPLATDEATRERLRALGYVE
jgi:arylsulfatase A-like enzyme